MRKLFLLSFCFLSAGILSGCSNSSDVQIYDEADFYIAEEDRPTIDATTRPNNRCGVDGISCNDSALVNYTQTEADYRAYGERTRRDHLYTQAGTGNNLTATIQPGIEEEIVVASVQRNSQISENSPFSRSATLSTPTTSGEVGTAHSMEIICEDRCDDLMNNDIITSEFTDDAFNPASDDETFGFKDIGKEFKVTTDIDVEEVKITDDTILTWEAEEGDNLRELLTKWCALSGWKLLWNTNRNYILSAGVMFKGKFADVSSALIRAFARARPAPIATYYKGNRVIVVETMENENAY